jgi:hypothetical protein
MRYTFSGHESFQCRHLWLKKGFDFVNSGGSFNDEDAVLKLGVGKNMVPSIRFWMNAFDLLDSSGKKTTELAAKIFSDNGWDPYLEDEATLWLLHYHLVKKSFASTFNLVFNELRREKVEFTKDNYLAFINRKLTEPGGQKISKNTLKDDFDVFSKTYIRSDIHSKDREDTFSGILTELELIKSIGRGKNEYYFIENTDRSDIPKEIIFYALLENPLFGSSVNLTTVEQEPNNVGAIFAITRSGLLSKIEEIASKYKDVIFNDHAGIKEIQFKKKPHPFKVLEKYYEN